jgi:transposase
VEKSRSGGGNPYIWVFGILRHDLISLVNPHIVVANKGYSYERIRHYLSRRRIVAAIPPRSDQVSSPDFDRATYRERNKVERLGGFLKQWRRIATRYEKRASNYMAMLMLDAIVLWLCLADTT